MHHRIVVGFLLLLLTNALAAEVEVPEPLAPWSDWVAERVPDRDCPFLQPGETRGCIGCHEDGERTPENRFVKALDGPSIALTLPPDKRRSVDYGRDVRPIVSARCSTSSCHADGLTDDGIGNYVNPGSARTSPLIWHIFGRDTSRPWDADPAGEAVTKMPPSVAGALTDELRRGLAAARGEEPAPLVRRRMARIRATSSRGLHGLGR